ncbi:lysozyme [Acinetobacter larvae]|uniref:Lysozyme n=1 Tax=Acinetobacter larvae TaxID=1789224 RepID=A0A1B2LXU4_9GAMM|nr:lysozyme [Acinetobacter larvae]AOA57583.1 lysozyme [Acinetobacter larvae]
MSKTKYTVTALTVISAIGVAFTTSYEGTVLKPYYDSGKVATIGTGTTIYPNGQRVKITDPPITKKQAAEYLQFHMNKDAQRFNKTLQGVKLSQDEYDLYMDFTYQFGTGAWQQSSMLRNLKAEQYVQACKSLLKWRYVAKKDCSIRSNNCYGVWTRQQARYNKCLEAQ